MGLGVMGGMGGWDGWGGWAGWVGGQVGLDGWVGRLGAQKRSGRKTTTASCHETRTRGMAVSLGGFKKPRSGARRSDMDSKSTKPALTKLFA